ncbi:MAG TPA: MgtC/SapB family protein [Acidobacteriota bacterium]|jgi:putative Mg2+ transporter-C (MgtC) family protein
MNWQLLVLGQIGIALLLSGLIGLERELAHKPAGLRTHMLVGAVATMLVALGGVIVQSFSDHPSLRTDPIRIFEAIIVGISFLGTGTIIQRRHQERVEGLTTAASLLFTAGIGISVALKQHVLAGGATVLILIVNRLLGQLEGVMLRRRGEDATE